MNLDLSAQYQEYYQALTDDERAEEKGILSDFAALENEINALIETEEADGNQWISHIS